MAASNSFTVISNRTESDLEDDPDESQKSNQNCSSTSIPGGRHTKSKSRLHQSQRFRQSVLPFSKNPSTQNASPSLAPGKLCPTRTIDKPKRSSIWDFFNKTVEKGMRICKLCDIPVAGDNTSNCWTHLHKHHASVLQPEPEDSDTTVTEVSDVEASPLAEATSTSTHTITEQDLAAPKRKGSGRGKVRKEKQLKLNKLITRQKSKYPKSSARWKTLNVKLLKMIVLDYQPFSVVNDAGFREYSNALDPRYELPSDTHLRTTVLDECYNSVHKMVVELLSRTKHIAITFDSWTNISHTSFVAVTGHFINESNGKLVSTLLKLIHTADVAHTAQNLATLIKEEALKNLGTKVVCAVTDNGQNMVKATQELGIGHLSCFAHTLQLVINAAVAGTADNNVTKLIKTTKHSVETFTESELQEIDKILEKENEIVTTSVLSIIQKCKKIVAYFNMSAKATALLRQELKRQNLTVSTLIQDVETRWNSTFYMLERIHLILDAINIVVPRIRNFPVSLLTPDEIEALPEIISLLRPFEEATRYLSTSSYPSISLIIPTVKGLLEGLNDLKGNIKTPIAQSFLSTLTITCSRLKEYENRTVTQMATLLDPRFKENGFMTSECYRAAVSSCKNELKSKCVESTDQDSIDEAEEKKQIPSFFSFLQKRKPTQPKNRTSIELIALLNGYLASSTCDWTVDPLAYWQQEPDTPLRDIALKFLIIPATSVPSECMFSIAGYMQTARRNKLKPHNLEKILFLNRNSNLLSDTVA